MHLKERFLSWVNKNGPVHPIHGQCWLWVGGLRDDYGYGAIKVDRKMERSHRISYKIFIGEIKEGLCVLHKCDNPLCVNPDHLFLGTRLDNSKDMFSKGRGYRASGINHGRHTRPERNARGESHGISKLTEAKVLEIRRKRSLGISLKRLAKEFGVCTRTIVCVVERITWNHVGG